MARASDLGLPVGGLEGISVLAGSDGAWAPKVAEGAWTPGRLAGTEAPLSNEPTLDCPTARIPCMERLRVWMQNDGSYESSNDSDRCPKRIPCPDDLSPFQHNPI